jgi:hypothetical protein
MPEQSNADVYAQQLQGLRGQEQAYHQQAAAAALRGQNNAAQAARRPPNTMDWSTAWGGQGLPGQRPGFAPGSSSGAPPVPTLPEGFVSPADQERQAAAEAQQQRATTELARQAIRNFNFGRF